MTLTSKPQVRSGFEGKVIDDLQERNVGYEYEPHALPYVTQRDYIPDLLVNGIYVELKGYFRSESQRKMRKVKEQHPEADIRFVFQKATSTVQGAKKRKDGTKMTCAEWADRYGFTWAEGTIPEEWL